MRSQPRRVGATAHASPLPCTHERHDANPSHEPQRADLYRGIADRYWGSAPEEALAQYTQLVSTGPQFGQHKDATKTGSEIVDGWPDHGYLTMGRQGGLQQPVPGLRS